MLSKKQKFEWMFKHIMSWLGYRAKRSPFYPCLALKHNNKWISRQAVREMDGGQVLPSVVRFNMKVVFLHYEKVKN